VHVEAALIPLLLQVALTFGLVLRLAVLRRGALRDGVIVPDQISLGQSNWPPQATQFANAFGNQFQLPILFYILCILAIITRQADYLFIVLAWLFVISRLVHAYIHTTYNKVEHRGLAFGLGCFTLMIMWIIFGVDVVIGI
jgi:hypothetical protein